MTNDNKLIAIGLLWTAFIVGMVMFSKPDRIRVRLPKAKNDDYDDIEMFRLKPQRPWTKVPRVCETHVASIVKPGIAGLLDSKNCDLCKKVLK